jgi:uncharacterized membrane protein HdeD (DUF308 family)
MAATPLLFEFGQLRRGWGWMLALGLLMVALGVIALFVAPEATLGTVIVLGWLLVISGVIEAIHAFRVRRWGGAFLHLAGGVLGVLIGLLVVTHPVAGALAWTLLFACFFTVIGLFRVVTAIALRFPNWGWAVFDGIVTLALGIILWAAWPWSGLWYLGIAVGVALIVRGWSYVMLAIALHNLPLPSGVMRQQAA